MSLEEVLFFCFAHRMLEPAWDSNHIAVCRCSSPAPKPAGARAHIARGRPEDLDQAQRMLKQGEETAGRPRMADHAGSPGCRAVLAAIGG
jgi:hypothetical protein